MSHGMSNPRKAQAQRFHPHCQAVTLYKSLSPREKGAPARLLCAYVEWPPRQRPTSSNSPTDQPLAVLAPQSLAKWSFTAVSSAQLQNIEQIGETERKSAETG
jgi:hypothetical protein